MAQAPSAGAAATSTGRLQLGRRVFGWMMCPLIEEVRDPRQSILRLQDGQRLGPTTGVP